METTTMEVLMLGAAKNGKPLVMRPPDRWEAAEMLVLTS